MADFTNLNLEGVNEKLNKSLTDAKALKDSLLANRGGDASAVLAALQSKVSDLQSSFADMIPDLPTIPNISMQSEFATLANLNITSPQYPSQVANIVSQFGPAMKAKGLDIESLATQIQSGGDIGELLPNLQLPAGEIIPVELPAEVSLPSKEAVEEEISKTNKAGVSLATKEIEVVEDEVSGATKTGTVVAAGGKPRLFGFNLYLSLRTYRPGTYINDDGRVVAIQRKSDKQVDALINRLNVLKNLPKGQTLRLFQSDVYDAFSKGGVSLDPFKSIEEQEKIMFEESVKAGDWKWKVDSAGFIRYDNRYNSKRKT